MEQWTQTMSLFCDGLRAKTCCNVKIKTIALISYRSGSTHVHSHIRDMYGDEVFSLMCVCMCEHVQVERELASDGMLRCSFTTEQVKCRIDYPTDGVTNNYHASPNDCVHLNVNYQNLKCILVLNGIKWIRCSSYITVLPLQCEIFLFQMYRRKLDVKFGLLIFI